METGGVLGTVPWKSHTHSSLHQALLKFSHCGYASCPVRPIHAPLSLCQRYGAHCHSSVPYPQQCCSCLWLPPGPPTCPACSTGGVSEPAFLSFGWECLYQAPLLSAVWFLHLGGLRLQARSVPLWSFFCLQAWQVLAPGWEGLSSVPEPLSWGFPSPVAELRTLLGLSLSCLSRAGCPRMSPDWPLAQSPC